MTKEELLSKISEKLGKTSLSERTLNSYVENIVKLVSDDSQINDDFLTSHVGILKSIEGQLSHDIADGLRGKGGGKQNSDPKPNPNSDPKSQGNDTMKEILEMISEIKKENSELREKLDEDKKTRTESSYKRAISDAMKQKGAKNDYILKQVIAKKKFDVNKPVEDSVKEALEDYDTEYKSCFGDGAAPRGSGIQDPSSEEIKKSLDAFFEKKANEGKFPSENK